MLHDPKRALPNGQSHMVSLTDNQAEVASYLSEMAHSLRALAKKHDLNFAAFCFEMARDSAFEASSNRIALRNKLQAHMAARKYETECKAEQDRKREV